MLYNPNDTLLVFVYFTLPVYMMKMKLAGLVKGSHTNTVEEN